MKPELVKKIRELAAVISLGDMSWNKTGTWSLLKPEFITGYPPCQEGCPAHIPIREILAKVRIGAFHEAAAFYLNTNPFPAITGRVCHHPCQISCLRGHFDQALEIRAVERFLAPYLSNLTRSRANHSRSKHHVAIIGSGPSGLACAYFLCLQNYQVTVFEKQPEPGGLLRYGIPSYRLPKNVVDLEIKRLIRLGIKFFTGKTIGQEFFHREVSHYDAVYLGIGAGISRRLHIPGETNRLVLPGLMFLQSFEKYRDRFRRKKIAVIGGGNTAMDAARTALRLGAEVQILYRRTRQEMPAFPEEIEGAIQEGCQIHFLTAPVRITSIQNQIEIHLQKMRLGEKDASGRCRPIPIPDSEFKRQFDYMVLAIGENPDFLDLDNLFLLEQNRVKIDAGGRTNQPGVFAGGDAAGYPRTVIDAIASGKRAAVAIHEFLSGKQSKPSEEPDRIVPPENVNTHYFIPQRAVSVRSLSVPERAGNFAEIMGVLSEKEGIREAARCFSCGVCTYCGNCITFCPDMAISVEGDGYRIREEYCKGCGICIKECPRGALVWKESR